MRKRRMGVGGLMLLAGLGSVACEKKSDRSPMPPGQAPNPEPFDTSGPTPVRTPLDTGASAAATPSDSTVPLPSTPRDTT